MAQSEGSVRIDAYIAKAQPFAQPVLSTLRARIRAALPEVEETLKWGAPAFIYKGRILCSMAGFKRHATFGFWHGAMVTGGTGARMTAMGDLGRITDVAQLPDVQSFADWIAKARQLIDEGVKPPHVVGRGKHVRAEIEMPLAFQSALNANAMASAAYKGFPPSARRDYLEWIADAKREETRAKRIAQAVEWLAEGKRRNWKYENC